MLKPNFKYLVMVMAMLTFTGLVNAQNKKSARKAKSDSILIKGNKHGANNMMLNASSETEPRFINVGLPEATGGTVVTENGMNVTNDVNMLQTKKAWRQDGSDMAPQSWNLSTTAIKIGDVGVSMATTTRTGKDDFAGTFNYKTNSFGLINGNMSISGPIKKNWYYSVNAFLNFNPGTTRCGFTQFLDRTQSYKGVLTKKFRNGEINFMYGYMETKYMNDNFSPYIFHEGKQVTAVSGFKIGRDSYLSNSPIFHVLDPMTGNYQDINLMDDTGTKIHTIGIWGDNKLANGFKLNYTLRYNHANVGDNQFAYFAISNTKDLSATQRYIYAGNSNNQVYTGLVQATTVNWSKDVPYDNLQMRVELSKKLKQHNLCLGYNNSYLSIDNYNSGSIQLLQAVTPNPATLILQKYVNGTWTNAKGDDYGSFNYNGSMFYYDGQEYKNAIYATDTWKVLPKLTLDLGTRFEWYKINGHWYPSENRTKNWISNDAKKISEDKYNKSFTLTATYRILPNFGFIGDAYYIEVSDGLSAYKGSNDPLSKTNKVPYFAGGVFYNSKWISVISRLSHISRSNLIASGGFSNAEGQSQKLTFNYGIQTLGWTTDAVLTPFTGFQLHLLLTLQNPKYRDFKFKVFGENYDYSNKPARITSKTLIEIDPSYTFGPFRVWASARYFSKQPCSYPASLYFPSRWETFGGVDYKASKKVSLSMDVVNIFNQVGAQGRIAGTNTATDPTLYYEKEIAGTYIRPFTVEFKASVKF